MMKVLIADDHRLMLEGIKRALIEAGDFEIVGEAENGAQVLPLVGRLRPDMVLLDLRMPQMDGLQCLSEIRSRYPEVKVAILSVSTDPEVIQSVLKRGAAAYIVKTVNPVDLPSALRQAAQGTVFTAVGLPEDGTKAMAKEVGLTERELVILDALDRK